MGLPICSRDMKGGEWMFLGLYTRVQTFWWGVRERITDERGAVATEYVLLLALIAVVIAAAASALATAIINKFNAAADSLNPP